MGETTVYEISRMKKWYTTRKDFICIIWSHFNKQYIKFNINVLI